MTPWPAQPGSPTDRPAAVPAAVSAGTDGRVLVVCTGNVARSPYLERRLRQLLGEAGRTTEVDSAGTGALVGSDMDPESAALLGLRGGDASGFVARRLTADIVAGADLVLCAAREHRAAVVTLVPRALNRTFTLGDLADLARGGQLAVAADELAATGQSRPAAVAAAAASLRGTVPPRSATDSDVVDPYRRGRGVYEQMARQIEADLAPVAAALVGRG